MELGESKGPARDFSGGSVAKTLSSQGRGPGFDPWSGFPDGLAGKNLPVIQETQVPFMGLEDPLEKEIATQPTPVSLMGNSMDRGAWWATFLGVAELDITEHSCTHTKGTRSYVPQLRVLTMQLKILQ